jgi:hypothetical protein
MGRRRSGDDNAIDRADSRPCTQRGRRPCDLGTLTGREIRIDHAHLDPKRHEVAHNVDTPPTGADPYTKRVAVPRVWRGVTRTWNASVGRRAASQIR